VGGGGGGGGVAETVSCTALEVPPPGAVFTAVIASPARRLKIRRGQRKAELGGTDKTSLTCAAVQLQYRSRYKNRFH